MPLAPVGGVTAAFIQLADVDVPRSSERSEIVLLSAGDNYHTLGLQIAHAFFFATLGCGMRGLLPGLASSRGGRLAPTEAAPIRRFFRGHAAANQFVREIRHELRDMDSPPRILVGGPIASTGLQPHPDLGIEVIRDLHRLDLQSPDSARAAG